LIYKASRDGYTAAKFHSLCDNKGPTLNLIKSEHNKIFGGYTSINWGYNTSSYKPDDKAFIFSLTNKTKHL
jgi:hypothetical protein